MSTKPDYRDLIVDHPSCSAKTQAERLDGTVYDDFEALYRSIRPGSIVRVYKPYLLGGAAGNTAKRRKVWAERADRAKAKGAKLMSIGPPLSGHKLTMLAAEQIGNIARGRPGKSKIGAPKKVLTPQQMTVCEKYWPPHKGWTIKTAIAKINELIAPRRVARHWLDKYVK